MIAGCLAVLRFGRDILARVVYVYAVVLIWIAVIGAAVRVWGEGMRLFRVLFLMLAVLALGASSARAQSDPRLLGAYDDAFRYVARDAFQAFQRVQPRLLLDDTATKVGAGGMTKRIRKEIRTSKGITTAAQLDQELRAKLDAVVARVAAEIQAGHYTRIGVAEQPKSRETSGTAIWGEGLGLTFNHTVSADGTHRVFVVALVG